MEKKQFSIAETFGLNVPKNLTVQGYKKPSEFTPKQDPDYIFRIEILRDVLAWLNFAKKEGLFLTGPTGCGKSSIIVETAARLNYPLYRITAHARMEFPELVGQFILNNGQTVFHYGPLARAMRDGGIFLLDEIDMLDPSVAVGLNGIVEGAPLCIPENGGEVIHPHPDFRFVATGNTSGNGNTVGHYSGTLKQNLAFLDRFWVLKVDYPEPAVEKTILKKIGYLPDLLIERFVQAANEIRAMFVGDGDEGNFENRIGITISTRGLVRWASLSVFYQHMTAQGVSPIHYALDRALLFRAEPYERSAVMEIVQRVFGDKLLHGDQQSSPND